MICFPLVARCLEQSLEVGAVLACCLEQSPQVGFVGAGLASRKVLWARAAKGMQYRDRAIFHYSRIHPIRLLVVVLVW